MNENEHPDAEIQAALEKLLQSIAPARGKQSLNVFFAGTFTSGVSRTADLLFHGPQPEGEISRPSDDNTTSQEE